MAQAGCNKRKKIKKKKKKTIEDSTVMFSDSGHLALVRHSGLCQRLKRVIRGSVDHQVHAKVL